METSFAPKKFEIRSQPISLEKACLMFDASQGRAQGYARFLIPYTCLLDAEHGIPVQNKAWPWQPQTSA